MSEKRFEYDRCTGIKDLSIDENDDQFLYPTQIVDLLNEQQSTISQLEEEKGYWKNKAMTLLIQVRRLIPRMTDKEVMEFSKELE